MMKARGTRLLRSLAAIAVVSAACTDYTSSSSSDASTGSDASSGACTAPQTECSGRCVDTRSDPAHCGSCGRVCEDGNSCVEGACTLACPAGLTACLGDTPDAGVDASHDATADAPADALLDGGDAAEASVVDAGPRGPYCAKLADDPANCGACGSICAAPRSCTLGLCCNQGEAACGSVCTVLATDGKNCGACGKVCPAATPSCIVGTCTARFNAVGVLQNVPVTTATLGFTECFREEYNGQTSLAAIQSSCTKNTIMMACRPKNATVLSLVAQAPRSDVFFDTGDGPTAKHEANGVAWYWSTQASFGFAPAGLSVDRQSCDYIDSYAGSPQEGTAQGDLRMCTHVSNGQTRNGFRCGRMNGLTTGWERILYHAD